MLVPGIKNCCLRLGVGSMPLTIENCGVAVVGASTNEAVHSVCEQVAIFGKAGERCRASISYVL
jgi:hypothetical protein